MNRTTAAFDLILRGKYANLNVKLKDFQHSTQLGKYTICSMLPIDHQMSPFADLNENSAEDVKDMGKDEANQHDGINRW